MTNSFFSIIHTLENERARLEPLKQVHFEPLSNIAIDNNIWQFTHVRINNPEDFESYFSLALSEKSELVSVPFAVFDKLTNQWAGSTRFGSLALEHKRAEIGWTWYGVEFHGSGLNTACKLLLLDFAFKEAGLNRVELKTNILNIRSQKAMEKLGAVKEGVFRRHMVNSDGTLRDSVYYSFIKEEWPQVRSRYFSQTY